MAKDQSSNVWLPSVVLATLAAISYLVHETAYQSSRPTESQSWSHKLEEADQVEARLWQDPFFAVDQHIRGEDGAKGTPHHGASTLAQHLESHPQSGAERLTLLAVMVPNAPYAEQAEHRRRIRYAVLSGLSRSQMVPGNQEHIGYFEPAADSDLPPVVPYEVFERNGTRDKPVGPSRVVLLWLATEASAHCPIRRAATLFQTVVGALKRRPEALDYVVMGPPESGTLAEMFVEAASDQCKSASAVAEVIDRLKIYSPFASAAGRELAYSVRARLSEQNVEHMYARDKDWPDLIRPCLREIDVPLDQQLQSGDCDIEGVIQKRVNFVRLIADDVLLAASLFDELKLRGVDPVCEAMERQHVAARGRPECFDGALDRHRIAIVSEWDTPYQRSLRRTLKRVLGERCAAAQYPIEECQAMLESKWIVPFSYMRGVDGQVAGDSAQPKEDKHPATDSGAPAGPKDTLERAQGNRQFDYLRRLAERIARKDAELETSGSSGIGAIAVLGSDPYDKLTILQALQEQLPDKMFVTSNLDARLLHPSEFKWARNLVVVSAFGLELNNDLQGDIPPLRDGYQTAAFFATQIAIRGYDFDKAQPYMRDQRSKAAAFLSKPCDEMRAIGAAPWLVPQIFEVGRTDAFRLERCAMPQEVQAPATCLTRWDFACLRVHPPSRPTFAAVPERVRVPMSIAAGLVMAGLILILWRPGSEDGGPGDTTANPLSATRVKIAVAIASFVLTASIASRWNDLWRWLTDGGAGEPAFIFEGISLWPAQMMRGAAFILALVFLVVAHRSLVRNARRIAHEFSVVHEGAAAVEQHSGSCLQELYRKLRTGLVEAWHRLSSILRARPVPSGGAPGPEQTSAQILDAWAHYCREAAACPRLVRVLAWSSVYTIISFCLIRIWPVIAPFRGSLSFAVNAWIVTLCVLAFNVLLFYVFDALYICNRCIGRLESNRPRWSEETYRRFRGDAGTDAHVLQNTHLDQWIAVHMIGRRTQAVGPLIYWPFLLLFLIILARNTVFEHWILVPSVIGYWIMSAALLVYAAVSLRRTTERVRERAIESLSSSLMAAKGTDNQRLAAQLQWMIDRLNGFNQGAFASYTDQHFIRALLLPLAGVAGSLLINYMSLVKP